MLTLKSSLFLLFVCLSLYSSGQVKYEWKEGNSNGYAYRYVSNDPMKARFYTLKNGLTVILSPNPKEPRIQTLIGVRAGSNNDPREHTGLAHYLEHMLFKGTYRFGSLDSTKEKPYINEIVELYDTYNHTTDSSKRKAIYRQIDSVSGVAATFAISNEYDKMMSAMGAQGTNAHTSVEETVYEENIPSNVMDKFLAVQAERFRNPVFRLFHTELEAVYEEKNRSLDSDNSKVWETLLPALFPTHNYGQQTTIGTIEHLKNPSLKAIRDFYEKYYVPDNMAIVMAGDLNPDEVIKKIDQAFSYMPASEVKGYDGPKEAPITAPITKEVFGPDAEFLLMAYRLPAVTDYQSSAIASVVSQLLSNGKAGLMDINLNKQQRVLSASAGIEYWKDYSMMFLNGKAKEGQSLEEVKNLMLSQVDLLRKGQFDETLIKAIVSNFKLYELNGLESNENRANSMMDSYIQHKGEFWNKDVSFIDDMAKVTKQQVIDYVNKYMGDSYVAVFKRKGESKNKEKVVKPPITPVAVNRDTQSVFVKKIDDMPAGKIQPKWVDYDKEIGKGKAGIAEVMHVQNKDNDLFRLFYRFDMGNWNSRELGLAAGYLQYLGDGKLSAEQISREFYNIACSFSVSPSNEYTTISISGLQENFDKAVKLFENLLKNCQPDEEALTSLKGRLVKSRADAKLNKGTIARGLTSYAIYGEKNPFNFQLSNDELKAVKAADLVKLLHELPNYKHAILYYGPMPLKTFVPAITKLHKLPAAFKPTPQAMKFEKKNSTAASVLFAPYDMVQSEITWIGNSMPYDTSKVALIQLFNNYFGGNMGSIVFQTIRESKALAYSTYAYYAPPDKKEGRYTTVAYVGSQADKMQEAVAAMNDLLEDLPRADKALQGAKESIRQDIASERITQDGIIFSYLEARRFGLKSDFRKHIYERVGSYTFQDLKDFHASVIADKPYTYCVVASPDRVSMDELKKLGEVKQLTLEKIFGY